MAKPSQYLVIGFAALLSVSVLTQQTVRAQQPPPAGSRGNTPAPAQIDPRQEMRKFIQIISTVGRQLKRDFVVLTLDGLNLLEQVDTVDTTRRVASGTYIRALDGLVVRGMHFQPPTPDDRALFIRTDSRITEERTRLANLGKDRGLGVLLADYAINGKIAGEAVKLALGKGFVPFVASGRGFEFDRIPRFSRRPINENPANIVGLRQVKNYLYLTDTSQFNSQEDFVEAMANTNYDALIIDLFHRGRSAFTPRNIHSMRFKKLGARRLVLAYMNIGHAETFRYYWNRNWTVGSPGFIASPVAGNPDRFFVQYWNLTWQKLLADNKNSYLHGIFSQGFDGVVLDGVDTYRFFEGSAQ